MFRYSQKLIVLLCFHAAWGIVLGMSISKYGLGVSSDSVYYMSSATNFVQGNGLIDFSGNKYILWPPLYPILIGFLHAANLSPFAAAHVIQFSAYALLSWFSSIYFLKLFQDEFHFAFAGVFLLATGSIVIPSFHMAGTDFIFSMFPVLLALLVSNYAETQKRTYLFLIGISASLAMLTRFVRIAVILTAVLAVFFYTRGTIIRRLLSTFWIGILSIPAFFWLIKSWMSTSGFRNAPLAFYEYFLQFTVGIIAWFTTDVPRVNRITTLDIVSVWGWIILFIVLFIFLFIKKRTSTPLVTTPLMFGVFYLFFLFGSAMVSYFNHLWGRFQLPIYFPLIVLIFVVIQKSLSYLKDKNEYAYSLFASISFTFLLTLCLMQANITLRLMKNAYRGDIPENNINTHDMNKNSILDYWNNYPPKGQFRILGNHPELVAFYTKHTVSAFPYRTDAFGNAVPIENYMDLIFENQEEDVYLFWVEPNTNNYIYHPYEFSPIATIEIIIENKDGGIYLLSPLSR